MAQTGFTPISNYYSTTASAVPTAANLVPGELAINTNDGKLYYEDSSGVVQVLATKGGVGTSSNTQVLYNSSGLVVGSAGLTYDGTNLTTTGTATATRFIPSGSTVATNGMFLPAANTLGFSTDSTERMRLTSAGRLGVGTSVPDARIDAEVASGAGYRAYKTTTGGFNALNLYTANENVIGTVAVATTADTFYLGYGTTPVLTWNGSGVVGVGGTIPATSGAGITFPATQSASTNVNTLDDYEEGTFTPVLGTSNGDTATMSVQEGKYIKVGKIVQFSLQVVWTAKNTWSFNTRISGLPFSATSNTGGYAWPNACQMDANVLTTLFTYVIESNATYGYIQVINATGAQLTESSFPSSGRVLVNGCYQTP